MHDKCWTTVTNLIGMNYGFIYCRGFRENLQLWLKVN